MIASRFERRTPRGKGIAFTLDGEAVTGQRGDTVAAALLAHDGAALRNTGVSGAPRTPYCMMGVCFDCLVTIDGVWNRQACMVELTEGMDIRRQSGFRRTEAPR